MPYTIIERSSAAIRRLTPQRSDPDQLDRVLLATPSVETPKTPTGSGFITPPSRGIRTPASTPTKSRRGRRKKGEMKLGLLTSPSPVSPKELLFSTRRPLLHIRVPASGKFSALPQLSARDDAMYQLPNNSLIVVLQKLAVSEALTKVMHREKSFKFLHLPKNVQRSILTLLLDVKPDVCRPCPSMDDEKRLRRRTTVGERPHVELLLTSKRIYGLAKKVLYSQNVFAFDSVRDLVKFAAYPDAHGEAAAQEEGVQRRKKSSTETSAAKHVRFLELDLRAALRTAVSGESYKQFITNRHVPRSLPPALPPTPVASPAPITIAGVMSPPSLLATSKGWRCRNFAATGARGRPKQRLAATKCLHTCHPLERKGESEPEDDDDMTVVDYNEDDDDDESLSVRTVKSNSSSNTSMSSRGSASSKVSAGDRAVHRLSAVMRSAWGRVGPVLSSNHLFPKLQCVQIRLGSDDPFNDQQQSMPPLMILLSAMDYLRPDLEKLRAERAELDVRLKLHMPNSSFDNVHREIEAWWCQFWNEAEVRVDVTPTD